MVSNKRVLTCEQETTKGVHSSVGGDLNLALWRSGSKLSILNTSTIITGHNACFPMCTATDKHQIKNVTNIIYA